MAQNSYTFALSPDEQTRLKTELSTGNYLPCSVPYTTIAVKAPSWDCGIALYTSGKCVIQGKGSHDFIENVLETKILRKVVLDADGAFLPQPLSKEALASHIGVDESGKGDFLGPMIIAAVHVNAETAQQLQTLGVCDSKLISSDEKALELAGTIRDRIGEQNYSIVRFSNEAYNKAYAKTRSVTPILAWGHARAIVNVRAKNPDSKFAISDQFAKEDTVLRQLRKMNCDIELRSRVRGEADIAVAAASILAREQFLLALRTLREHYGMSIPKGASSAVDKAAADLVRKCGPSVLEMVAKCHFANTDTVLKVHGWTRDVLPPDCRFKSRPYSGKFASHHHGS